jgi:hypothetical protein
VALRALTSTASSRRILSARPSPSEAIRLALKRRLLRLGRDDSGKWKRRLTITEGLTDFVANRKICLMVDANLYILGSLLVHLALATQV